MKRGYQGKSLNSWKWSGCSHNMNYGIKFAKMLLDSRERSKDLPSRINIHNNKVGRLVSYFILYIQFIASSHAIRFLGR